MANLSGYFGPFQRKYSNYDFKLIQDVISQYYPAKSARRYSVEKFHASAGGKKLDALMAENFLDEKNFRERWVILHNFLEKEMNKTVEQTVSFDCCYSGEVVLEETRSKDFVRSKKLHFYISVLGPFFSIHGIDSSSVLLPVNRDGEVKPMEFDANHVLTVSPVFEYEASFTLLESKLREFFHGYRFVPYQVGMSTIRNISRKNDWEEQKIIDTVYEGLFGQIAVHDLSSRGDEAYGFADWTKPLSITQKKLLDLIAKHIWEATNETTIHKVWKLKEYKPLHGPGGGMIGVEVMDTIDLTNRSKAIVNSNAGPGQMNYKLRDNIIEFYPDYYFEIVELASNSLTVNLTINIPQGVSLGGTIGLELKFIQMKPRA